jgi:signal transduction histidine kinase
MAPRPPASVTRLRTIAAGLATGGTRPVDGAGPEGEDHLVRGLLAGVAAFRWLAWAWMAALLLVNRSDLQLPDARPWLAVAMAAAALAVTAGLTVLLFTNPSRLLTAGVVVTELAVGFTLEMGDRIVYNGISHSQSLASAWPLAGLLTAGIAFRSRGGAAAGAIVGLGRVVGELVDPTMWSERDTVSSLSTIVLYTLAGGLAGFVTARLRTAEQRISAAQAREEVARTLHDGVLQTLAIVQRRSDDPTLSRLARDQERELREFLFGVGQAVGSGGDLGSRLRQAAALFEDRFGGTARVVVADDVPPVASTVAHALAGAVGEALANAGKHGGASTVTVFVEPTDGELFCSVKDDGVGFDAATVTEGEGLARSVRGRIAEVGGRVEVDGRPGRGTEVRCWVPTSP